MKLLSILACVVTEERRATEAKRMNESSKRRLMMGLQGKKVKWQAGAAAVPSVGVDPEDQTFVDRLRQLNAKAASAGTGAVSPSARRGQILGATSSKAVGKRPMTVDLEAELAPKRTR
ncbi:unnamed protein product [Prunus armeniaca]